MRVITKSAVLAAGLVAAATMAGAATLDFTTLTTFSTSTGAQATGVASTGTTFTITGSGGALTYNASTGPGAVGGLAGETDGLGIGDDEVGGTEYITIFFDKPVRLTGASFLDMFLDPSDDAEQAWVYAGTPPAAGVPIGTVTATQIFVPGGAGFRAIGGLSQVGQSFSFDAGTGNDGQGIGDFALAGLTFEEITAVIPLPAGALLLGSALWGFGLIGRRKG